MNIIDPAVGSGHFLIAAAHRLAGHLARVRAGDDEPTPDATRHALREVIGQCLYGIDINPMAAELCKVALWMESLEPGKPLGFLDHHIVVGNALLGATPEMLVDGIPDAAYDSISDASRKVELKKQNRREREGERSLFFNEVTDGISRGAATIRRIDSTRAEKIEDVRRQEHWYLDYTRSREFEHQYAAADLFLAPFLPDSEDLFLSAFVGSGITTETVHRAAELRDDQLQAVKHLRTTYRFLHPHLAFPDVFEKGGFDLVIGNPPWERVKLQEKEFFAGKEEAIVSASNASARRRLIDALKVTNPRLYKEFKAAKAQAEGESAIMRLSGRYPLAGRGDINTYAVFAELFRSLVGPKGRAGIIVPTGIATDDTTKLFFADLMDNRSLSSLFDFENGMREADEPSLDEVEREAPRPQKRTKMVEGESDRRLFPSVHASFKFCLLTVTGSGLKVDQSRFAFFCHRVTDLATVGRVFELSLEDIARLNPNTRTCPVFRTRRDAEITKSMYAASAVLRDDNDRSEWSVELLKKMVDFTIHRDLLGEVSASGQIRMLSTDELEDLSRCESIYEAKLIHQYDHRYASYSFFSLDGDRPKNISLDEKQDPALRVFGRFWMLFKDFEARISGRPVKYSAFLSLRGIARTTDERTLIAAIRPLSPAFNSIVNIFVNSPTDAALICACLNSFASDFVARQKLGGANLDPFVIFQLAIIPKATFRMPCPWQPHQTITQWMLPYILELTFTATNLGSFAKELGFDGQPFKWNEERRFFLRSELDAAFFHLFGVPRDDVDYILESFPIVKRKDVEAHGSFRTKEVILRIYDEMGEAMLEVDGALNTMSVDDFMSTAYGSNSIDRFLCSAVMDSVTRKGELNTDEVLDILLLAAHPDRLRTLLDPNDQAVLESFVAMMPTNGVPITSVRWRDCLKHLEQGAHAVLINRDISPHRVISGPTMTTVLASYPQLPNGLTAILLKALARLALPSASLASAERMIQTQFAAMREAEIASL